MNGWTDGWMNGWMDEWMDGWTDGQTNRWMDGFIYPIIDTSHNQLLICILSYILAGYNGTKST